MSKIEIALLATAILFVFLLALRSWHNAMKRRAAAEWEKEQERRRQVDNQQRQAAQMAVQNSLSKRFPIPQHGAQIIRPERIVEFKRAASASLNESAELNREWDEKLRRQMPAADAAYSDLLLYGLGAVSTNSQGETRHIPAAEFHGGGGTFDGGGASGDWGGSSSSSDSSSSSSCSSSSSDSGSSSSSDSGSSCSSD